MNNKKLQKKIVELLPNKEFTVPEVESLLKQLGYKGFLGLFPVDSKSIYSALYELEYGDRRVHSWWGKDSMERSQMLFKVIHSCD